MSAGAAGSTRGRDEAWIKDLVNPFRYPASEAGKVIADGWTSVMLGLWNPGLWALRAGAEHH